MLLEAVPKLELSTIDDESGAVVLRLGDAESGRFAEGEKLDSDDKLVLSKIKVPTDEDNSELKDKASAELKPADELPKLAVSSTLLEFKLRLALSDADGLGLGDSDRLAFCDGGPPNTT